MFCSTFHGPAHCNGIQICFYISVQHQIRISQRVIVDQPIQFGPLIHVLSHPILHLGTVNGNQCIIGSTQPLSILYSQATNSIIANPSFRSAHSLYRMVSAAATMRITSFTDPPASDFSEIVVECCAWHPAQSGRLLRLKHPQPLQVLYRSWNSNSAAEAVWLV